MARWQKICLFLLHNRHGHAITFFYKNQNAPFARKNSMDIITKSDKNSPTSKDMGSLNRKGNQSTPDWDAR